MKKEYISFGKNVDLAIKNGLLEIGKTREEVDIKILETGGLFKKAKVNLIYEIEEVLTQENTENLKIEEEVQPVEDIKQIEQLEILEYEEPVQQESTNTKDYLIQNGVDMDKA